MPSLALTLNAEASRRSGQQVHDTPSGYPITTVVRWLADRMAAEPRAGDRATGVLFRMSHEDKAKIKARALELDITVQALLERIILGQERAVTRPPGRIPKMQKEQLPLTG